MTEATVFRFSFISFASLILLYTLTRMAVVFLRKLHQRIIDDNYLRGMQLHNYENANQYAANNNNVNNNIDNVDNNVVQPQNEIAAQ